MSAPSNVVQFPPQREPAGKIARRLAERYKFKVFPVARDKKTPLISNWPELATSDPDAVEAMFSVHPDDCNIGIHLGSDFVAVDSDAKKDGLENFQHLDMTEGWPATLTTLTANGGKHSFYRLPKDHPGVANGVDVLARGIDIRGNHGYVVAPGSVLEGGKKYAFEAETALIADAPQWLLDRLAAYVPRERRTGAMIDVPDAPEATVEQALAWLKSAERSTKGAGGDQAAYRVACQLRDRGLSYGQACDAMRSDAWDHGCGWREGRLEEKPIRSAYRYAQGEAGAKGLTDSDFAVPLDPNAIVEPSTPLDPVADAPVKPSTPFDYMLAKAYDLSKPRRFIIKGIAAPGHVIEILAKPGDSKTVLLCYTAKAIARGKEWFSTNVKKYAVVYVASEGKQDVLDRLAGYDVKYGVDPNEAPIYVLDRVNLASNEERDKLVSTIEAIEKATGSKIGAMIVDTLAASTSGDENDNSVMKAVAQRVKTLAERQDLAVFVAHHPTKSDPKVSRGGGAWVGGIDQQIFITRAGKGNTFYLSGGKQRSGGLANTKPRYDLGSAGVGVWEDGEVISVPVVVENGVYTEDDFAAPDDAHQELQNAEIKRIEDVTNGKAASALLKALQSAQAASGGAAVTGKLWRAHYRKVANVKGSAAHMAVARYVGNLIQSGAVKAVDVDVYALSATPQPERTE